MEENNDAVRAARDAALEEAALIAEATEFEGAYCTTEDCSAAADAIRALKSQPAQQPGDVRDAGESIDCDEPYKVWNSAAEFLADHPESFFEGSAPVSRQRLAFAVDFLAEAIDSCRPAAAPTDESRYACNLAIAIWEKHYKVDAPQWKVLPDTYGALSQIDNMVTGLSRAAIAAARPSAPSLTEDQLRKAMRQAFSLGQIYWQQADSEYVSQNKKSDATAQKFHQLTDDTCAILAASPAPDRSAT